MAFAPQNHDVVVLLEVQLRGEDEWLGVRISCPLIQTNSDGTPLIPACEWRLLTGWHKRRTFLLYSVAAWGILVVMKSFTSGYLQCASSQVLPGKCEIDRSLRVDCGQPSISSQECVNLGCCYDEQDSVCFYRLNGEIGAHRHEWKLSCAVLYVKRPFSLQPALWMDTLCSLSRQQKPKCPLIPVLS